MVRLQLCSALKQLWQLCVYVCASLYVSARRRSFVSLASVLTIALVLLMVQWGIICLDMQSWWHVHRVCLEYTKKAVDGSMCAPLCQHEGLDSLSCQNYYMGKEAVFAATWGDMNVIFKAPKRSHMGDPEALYWIDDNSLIHYPSDSEFENMVKDNVKIKFNITVSEKLLKSMSHFHFDDQNYMSDRVTELRDLWFLLQDNEYLAMILYEQYDFFPKLLGSCGPFYTMPRMKTITQFSHLISLDSSREKWQNRVRLALLILDFLTDLEHKASEPLHLCDVKINHFGVTDALDKVKYLDLDAVHPRSIANRITGDGSVCAENSDCDYFDCRSFCDRATRSCRHPVANNNLQIVCEKVFLGWAVSGRVLVPGLLVGPHAPRALLEELATCANPAHEPPASRPRAPASPHVRGKIYNILTRLKISS